MKCLFFLDMFSGLLLGLLILFEGIFMDRFLSYDDYTELIKNKTTRQLYNEGIQTVKTKLIGAHTYFLSNRNANTYINPKKLF